MREKRTGGVKTPRFLFINTSMKSFMQFKNHPTVVYGKLQPHDEAKIKENDKIISHFRETGLLSKYEKMSHPNETETLRELMQLKDIMKSASDDDMIFANFAETDEQEMYRKFAKKIGIHLPHDYVSNVLDQTDPILFYLKKHHNRARPEQFANAHRIPFQAAITHTAFHPAFPSGHAFDSYIMEHVLKQLSPNHSAEIEKFTEAMRNSRLHAGLHYPSDNEVSKKLAQDVIENNLIELP